jgi:Na+/phosphate symporter
VLTQISEILNSTIVGLTQEDLKQLRKTKREVEKINKKTKALKDNISDTISHLEESSIDTGHYYVQVLDYLREMAHSISFINKPSLDHVDNNHKALLEVQVEELTDMTRMIREFVRQVNQIINDNDTNQIPEVIEKQSRILKFIDTSRKKQVKRIKANEVGTRNSMLFLGILSESKNLMLQSVNLLKSYRDFTDYVNGNSEVV